MGGESWQTLQTRGEGGVCAHHIASEKAHDSTNIDA